MSWVSHDLEPYILQRHLTLRISFVALLIGSYGPDLATKWFAYGISIGSLRLHAADPTQFHRGWPGVGFTHSLLFGVAVAALIYVCFHSKAWALGFLIGQWAHALTDTLDTVGTMLLFPWTHHFSVGLWVYTAQSGRFLDAASYFSGPAAVWDGLWVILVLLAWRVFTRQHFLASVAPRDGFWSWVSRRLPEDAVLALYRAPFFYGAARWTAWLLWAHVVHHYPFDLTWGGPHWAYTPTEAMGTP